MINIGEKEVWRTYPEYPFIEANQFGEVRTKDRVVIRKNGRKLSVKGRVLKQYDNGKGYMRVTFRFNNKTISLRVSRIVATCFIPNPNNLPEVNHIDCNRSNNVVSNLEWCTHQENVAYSNKLGHTAKHNAPKKPVIAVNLETLEVCLFESQHEAARQLRIDVRSVNDVIKGRQKTTHIYWFCNVDEKAVENTRTRFGDEVANKVEKIISGKIWGQEKTKNKQ